LPAEAAHGVSKGTAKGSATGTETDTAKKLSGFPQKGFIDSWAKTPPIR
jgi:hypothetical protein